MKKLPDAEGDDHEVLRRRRRAAGNRYARNQPSELPERIRGTFDTQIARRRMFITTLGTASQGWLSASRHGRPRVTCLALLT